MPAANMTVPMAAAATPTAVVPPAMALMAPAAVMLLGEAGPRRGDRNQRGNGDRRANIAIHDASPSVKILSGAASATRQRPPPAGRPGGLVV